MTFPDVCRREIYRCLVGSLAVLLLLLHGLALASGNEENPAGAKLLSGSEKSPEINGLVVGAKVTIRKKNQELEGVLTQVSPDKDPITVLTDNKREVKVLLEDVRRIVITGDVIKKSVGNPRLTRGYLNSYRFEMVNGLVVEGGPTVLPFFQLELETGRQTVNLRQLSLIETSSSRAAPGLTLSSRVRCKIGDKGVFGTIVGLNFPKPDAEIVVITASGETVLLPLRDLIRIRLVKAEVPVNSPTPVSGVGLANIYEFTTANGKIVKGKVLQPPLFTIDTGNGIRRNVWADMAVIEKQ